MTGKVVLTISVLASLLIGAAIGFALPGPMASARQAKASQIATLALN